MTKPSFTTEADRRLRRARNAARRARERGVLCTCCKPSDLIALYMQHGPWELDHRKPMEIGGLHCLKNLQVLTYAEHMKKNVQDYKDIERYWMETAWRPKKSDKDSCRRPVTRKQLLALCDIRAAQRPLRKIAPASPYAPIRTRALGPRDLQPKDPTP